MKRGAKTRDEFFTVFAVPNTLPHGRLGLAVSRRVSLKAVCRNRIKRQVREAFRHGQAQLSGLDVVVVAQGPAVPAKSAQLQTSLVQHWSRVVKQCARS